MKGSQKEMLKKIDHKRKKMLSKKKVNIQLICIYIYTYINYN